MMHMMQPLQQTQQTQQQQTHRQRQTYTMLTLSDSDVGTRRLMDHWKRDARKCAAGPPGMMICDCRIHSFIHSFVRSFIFIHWFTLSTPNQSREGTHSCASMNATSRSGAAGSESRKMALAD
jgi:hypothetical protein